jgi:tRNA(Arg) A34 adenosine deaminase TadA
MWSGIKKIYYGASAKDLTSIGLKDMYQGKIMFDKLPIKMIQIKHKDALKVFDVFKEI